MQFGSFLFQVDGVLEVHIDQASWRFGQRHRYDLSASEGGVHLQVMMVERGSASSYGGGYDGPRGRYLRSCPRFSGSRSGWAR